MLRTLFIAAGASFCLLVVCIALLLGGCGKKRKAPTPSANPPVACAVPTFPDAWKGGMILGDDPSLLGRVEKTVTVEATVYHAERGASAPGPVTLSPGTWLLPASAMTPPDEAEL